MLSKEGQEVVVKDGYMPLTAGQRQGRAREDRQVDVTRGVPEPARRGTPAFAAVP